MRISRAAVLLLCVALAPAAARAQSPTPVPTQPVTPAPTQPVAPVPQPSASVPAPAGASTPAPAEAAAVVPPDYVIGADDILSIVFWEQANHGGEVIVRPDGKITLPLINDVQAAGLTPEQLRQHIVAAAARYLRDPNVTVIVKQTNSRRVYVTGRVNKPGTYVLTTPVTVLQMLALAGGIGEFAKKDRIVVMRTEGDRTASHKFNYGDVIAGKKLEQNILLRPGDTIIVP
ncbi:MAG TPA: polysaccharide biosynthesis/export family protein [Luteitalea sp.]|nr:polysaccharide biosynthesis/export family protein [Luteitalea sp.]